MSASCKVSRAGKGVLEHLQSLPCGEERSCGEGFAGFGKHLLMLAKSLSSPAILCSLPFVAQPSSAISTKKAFMQSGMSAVAFVHCVGSGIKHKLFSLGAL